MAMFESDALHQRGGTSTPGAFVAAAHLQCVHVGDVVTVVLDHVQHTAQLAVHA